MLFFFRVKGNIPDISCVEFETDLFLHEGNAEDAAKYYIVNRCTEHYKNNSLPD